MNVKAAIVSVLLIGVLVFAGWSCRKGGAEPAPELTPMGGPVGGANGQFTTIRVQRIELVDEKGKLCLVIEAKNGSAFAVIAKPGGKGARKLEFDSLP